MTKFSFKHESISELKNCSIPEIDVSYTTPERNFSCDAASRVVNVIYEDVRDDAVVWQPDVLWEAKKVADRFNIKKIIDIGCGNGDKLINYFGGGDYDVIGIDFLDSLKLSRSKYPQSRWIDCDLTSYDDLARCSTEIMVLEPAIYVLSDVIEHLTDPRVLIAWIRKQLMINENSCFIISTPDRLRLGYKSPISRPRNEAHIREWSIAELQRFFVSSGFEITRSGHTRANQFDTTNSSIYLELRCTEQYYCDFLKNAYLLNTNTFPEHLLVTTEYAGAHNTGGIGTFVREQREAYGIGRTLCLLAVTGESFKKENLVGLNLISPSMLTNHNDLVNMPLEDQIVKAVQQLLFFFPDIKTVQYGDYQGSGCRIAQAKRAGMLPEALTVIVHCHGITHYLENAHEAWFGSTHFGVAEKEKISIESADLVTFPTDFLRQMYAETGIILNGDQVCLQRYPLNIPVAKLVGGEKIDTIIFFGKRTSMKGHKLFLRSLFEGDSLQWKDNGIKTICFIGPKNAFDAEEISMLEMLSANYIVENLSDLGRVQALDAIHSRAHHAICVMPYLGDNHPYALLDVIYSTALPLMVKAGGVPEMFPESFHDTCLSDPDEVSLQKQLLHLIQLPVEEIQELRSSLVVGMHEIQQGINERVAEFPSQGALRSKQKTDGKVTVIVPVYNTSVNYVEDLVFGINNQTLKPSEVIFIDDASDGSYVVELKRMLERKLQVPYRLISHERNRGLAGARNTGLAETKTEFLINLDSDDVPLNDFIRDIIFTLENNADVSAAVPYLSAFDEGTDFNLSKFGGYVYRPIGDGVISSQIDNQLGHANSGFRTSVLRELGGWDGSSKAMWEDWALYLRFVSAGRRIAVIPKTGCLYRVRKNSMLRTYKTWPAMRRLANNMLGLPRYENFRLQAMMRSYGELIKRESILVENDKKMNEKFSMMLAENAQLSARVVKVELDLNRLSVRIVRRISDRCARYPVIFNMAKKIGVFLIRLIVKIIRK